VVILETENIRKEFGTLVAVNDVNISVEEGQVLGLIGPNGAGKTTLLRMLGTLLRPSSGNAKVKGYDLSTEYIDIRKDIGFLPDFFNLYSDLTIEECLEYFARAYHVDGKEIPTRVEKVLSYIELEEKRHSLIRNLSRGMVQRMGVGSLLVHEPALFLLDEPASGLDPTGRIQLRKVLKKISQEGKTIIISSHILTELSGFCTHIVIMNKGVIEMAGAVEDIERQVLQSGLIHIRVLDDAEKALEVLRHREEVKIIKSDGNEIIIETTKEPEKVAQLNSELVGAGIKVVSFSVEKANLEDVFMEISKRE
jgi:ABC-2 type transport system ATP-binding protein